MREKQPGTLAVSEFGKRCSSGNPAAASSARSCRIIAAMRERRSSATECPGGRAANPVSVIGISGKVHLRWLIVLVDDNVYALTPFNLIENRFVRFYVGTRRRDDGKEIHELSFVKRSHSAKIRSRADPRHIENGPGA